MAASRLAFVAEFGRFNLPFRLTLCAAQAFVATVGLFWLMNLMIHRDAPNLGDDPARRIVDIIMEEQEIETRFEDEERTDKPEDPEEPPPEPELPDIEEVEVEQDIDLSLARTGVSTGLGAYLSADGEYLPIVKVAPIYPRSAQTRGIEGYCVVSYTVTVTGAVRDPRVVECSSSLFRSASLRASTKFKYKPRVIDGEPVEVHGVLNKFTYELED